VQELNKSEERSKITVCF